MTYAAITGWGKCMPPAVLSNADLATFVDTDRRMDHAAHRHPRAARLARVRARARPMSPRRARWPAPGSTRSDVDLIVYGSCSNDEQIPNTASGLSLPLGAGNAAAMDINTACTSFLYGLSTATAMIRTGVVKTARGGRRRGDQPVHGLAQPQRRRAVRRRRGGRRAAGDRRARPACSREKLGCYADARGNPARARHGIHVRDARRRDVRRHASGTSTARKSSSARSAACARRRPKRWRRCGKTADDIDLVVPHQANLRIIEFVAKRAGVPMDRVFVTVHKYGNMSAATVPVALVEALEDGRVQPGSAAADARVRRRPHVVLARDPLGRAGDAARAKRRRSCRRANARRWRWRAIT